MIPLPFHIKGCFILFTNFALAVLQNVTVDDAVLTGPAVPQYLPPGSTEWHQGNNCSVCRVKPDPSLAYNGTWHQANFRLGDGATQGIEFTFTGTALYIFFITANMVINDTALLHTDVYFVLDGTTVGRYTHDPSAVFTDFQYNVPVYVNESMTSGQHDILVQAIVSTNARVLMLFDYLIYTMDTSFVSSSSAAATPSSPVMQATSSRPNIGAVVGGTMGGVAVVIFIVASLLCYQRYKRSTGDRPIVEDGAVIEPFVLPCEMAHIPSTHPDPSTDHPVTQLISGNKEGAPSTTHSLVATTTPPPSGDPSSGDDATVLGQIEQLRAEIRDLRNLHDPLQNWFASSSEAPPEYSHD